MSPLDSFSQAPAVLVCAECANAAPHDARGWRALLTVGNEDAEDAEELAVYCPECAAREFGGRAHLFASLD